LTLPHPGGQGSEAALVVMERDLHCDRNRGTEQDEFYHGKISFFDPSDQAISMPISGILSMFQNKPISPKKGSRALP
jgi:hypothetical protein